ncbi:MAG: CaiB/BaiF CoA-transferase family protein [Thermodesulfobacteriota bacterium]
MEHALAGLKVLDLTMNLPGPYMTWLLAELGAEVLKVENPQGGDYARALASDGEGSPVFDIVNRKKKSLTLNLKTEEGRDIFFRLLDQYDVLVEGFRPGVMASLGLDYERAKARQPRLIYVSISGYGQDGPYRLRGGHDLNYLSLAGIIQMTGTREGVPVIPGIQIADLAAGSLLSLAGLLAAVIQRERTGRGQYVDAAMYDGSFALTAVAFSTMLAGLDRPGPGRMFLTGAFPFYHLYPAKDGRYMSLGAVEFKFWRNFCLAVGREDLVEKQFGGPEVIAEVAGVFAGRTQAEWIEFLKEVDACCEPVLPLDEAAASPLARARGLVDRTPDGRRFLAPPLKMSGSPRPADAPPPTLGQHSAEVLGGLGFGPGEIEVLKQKGVI